MGKLRYKKNKTKVKTQIQNESTDITMDDDGDDDNVNENELEEHNDIDFDKRSVISNKTIKSLVSTKKDKIKLKRDFLLKRLHAAHEMKRAAKERMQRKQTVIVSDMKHEFENSLSQIESYLEEQRLAKATKKSTRKQIPSQRERNRESQDNVNLFNKISNSIECSTNPFELIKKQLEQQILGQSIKK